ncbi:hypothetical protein EVAR_53050_1 [Eumeta japonica]|uniref:Uncharacterized protein n=1 Tax=Eumeta variegata TaxID=151549 RepID=A0A4C1YWJ4_EUMVA|nr:hypothetical protein EVAR_53050_1 [Eumeta japonica]
MSAAWSLVKAATDGVARSHRWRHCPDTVAGPRAPPRRDLNNSFLIELFSAKYDHDPTRRSRAGRALLGRRRARG